MAFRKVKKEDSFGQWFIDSFGIDAYNERINHIKNIENNIDLFSISKRSLCDIWFICENKDYHEYCLSADKYYKGNRCKYCGRTKYVHPLDSFGQYILDNYGSDYLEKIWNSQNKQSAFKYKIGSEEKVYFNCSECGAQEHLQQIKNYVRWNFVCEQCKTNTSNLHKKCIQHITDLNLEFNLEYDCSLLPINPLTKNPLPFDIEIVNHKIICEVHGKQHYEQIGHNSKWLHGLSSAEYLAKRQKYDKFKKDFALSNGYYYLEIPYWTEKNDEYKKVIDEKIKEVINMRTTTETKRAYQ